MHHYPEEQSDILVMDDLLLHVVIAIRSGISVKRQD